MGFIFRYIIHKFPFHLSGIMILQQDLNGSSFFKKRKQREDGIECEIIDTNMNTGSGLKGVFQFGKQSDILIIDKNGVHISFYFLYLKTEKMEDGNKL